MNNEAKKDAAVAIRSAINELITEGRKAFLVDAKFPEYGYGCGICYALARKMQKAGRLNYAYKFMGNFINNLTLYCNGLGADGKLSELRIWTILILDQLTVEEIEMYLESN
jgi:hypothetical protein